MVINIIKTVVDWIERENRSLIIGISGHGAAGKTTFLKQLIQQLSIDVNVLNTDTYVVSSNIRNYTMVPLTYDGVSYTSKMTACHPAAHYVAALERDIEMLANGMDVVTLNARYAPHETMHTGRRVTIIEGMSVAFTNAELFDLRLYFYTDSETELQRRKRQGINLDSHDSHRMQYEVFMHPCSEQFDIVVKSTIAHPWIVEKNMLF